MWLTTIEFFYRKKELTRFIWNWVINLGDSTFWKPYWRIDLKFPNEIAINSKIFLENHLKIRKFSYEKMVFVYEMYQIFDICKIRNLFSPSEFPRIVWNLYVLKYFEIRLYFIIQGQWKFLGGWFKKKWNQYFFKRNIDSLWLILSIIQKIRIVRKIRIFSY